MKSNHDFLLKKYPDLARKPGELAKAMKNPQKYVMERNAYLMALGRADAKALKEKSGKRNGN